MVLPTLRLIVVPTTIAHPLGMAAIGLLLRDSLRKIEIREELTETKARFQELTDHIDEVFWIYDLIARRMAYVSPRYERMIGQPASALYEDPRFLFSLMEPEDRPDRSDFWKSIVKEDRPPDKSLLECRIRRPDGVFIWIAVRAFPLRDAQGTVYRIVGTLADISERKRAEQERMELQVERSNTVLLRQFINDVSHDFRTPLSIVSMSAYLLGRSLKEPAQVQRVDDMQAQVNRMTQVIDNMVMLSRLYDAELDTHREKRDLRDLVGDVIRREEPSFKVKCQSLKVTQPSEAVWVEIDFHYMSIALMSIVNNAIQYTPENGSIFLRLSVVDRCGRVCVEDTGIGIPEEDLPHIFERFYRVDKARGVDTGGSGLGLAIAQKVVETHGGQIEVRSEPGKGSCFEIILPISQR